MQYFLRAAAVAGLMLVAAPAQAGIETLKAKVHRGETNKHVFTAYVPNAWENDWDVMACLATTKSDQRSYWVYEWKPGEDDVLQKDEGAKQSIAAYEERKNARIEIARFSADTTTVTFAVTPEGKETRRVNGVCWNREVSFHEIYEAEDVALSLKWDKDAGVCRWKAMAKAEPEFEDYGAMPERMILESQLAAKHSTTPRARYFRDTAYLISFFDDDDFWLGEREFPVTVNAGAPAGGWFGGEEGEHICNKSVRMEARVKKAGERRGGA